METLDRSLRHLSETMAFDRARALRWHTFSLAATGCVLVMYVWCEVFRFAFDLCFIKVYNLLVFL